MSLAPDYPAVLASTLEHLGLSEMLTGFVPRQHVTRRVSWQEFMRFVKSQDYEVVTEGGNIYGRVGVCPAVSSTAPTLRLITRSDHAAVYGSRPRAA